MNPSASDWIPKFLSRYQSIAQFTKDYNEDTFYNELLKSGFIYGISEKALGGPEISSLKLTREELTKINLFHALLFLYLSHTDSESFKEGVTEIISFYKKLEKGKGGFLRKLSLSHSPSKDLETILSVRIQETNEVMKLNTTSILTYAFLFTDVLAFRYWMHQKQHIKDYARSLEHRVLSCALLALSAKKKKNKYDKLLIALFASTTDTDEALLPTQKTIDLKEIAKMNDLSRIERRYILDLCCIAVWDDHQMDEEEYQFLKDLAKALQFDPEDIGESLKTLAAFSGKQKESIQLFEYSNPVKLFYNQSATTVKLLILRNKDRLLRELEESGELLVLLSQSTLRELSSDEKGKVRSQLLDICKSVPSLTIFLLPGGSVLLPLLVKFIPKLLPSAFHDNRIDKK